MKTQRMMGGVGGWGDRRAFIRSWNVVFMRVEEAGDRRAARSVRGVTGRIKVRTMYCKLVHPI